MNKFGKLRWEFEPLTLTTTFLDLNITLHNQNFSTTLRRPTNFDNKISFSTYQKDHNLYLYIPPHSAHPPGTTRSLIHGLLQKYWSQNTKINDFHKITNLLFHRLLARGHSETTLRSFFLQAANSIDKKQRHKLLSTTPKATADKNSNDIFLKWKFHPKDITRQQLQHSYRHTCELHSFAAPQGFRHLHTDHGPIMNINKLTIAYTREKNLRDILIPSRLPNIPKYTASKMLLLRTKSIQSTTKN